jgi:hypothetical protein
MGDGPPSIITYALKMTKMPSLIFCLFNKKEKIESL